MYLTDCMRFYKRFDKKTKHDENIRMALNIAKQISEKTYTKNILIVGAGHAISSSSLYHPRKSILTIHRLRVPEVYFRKVP